MNRRQRKKSDKRILKNGDLSYCRFCGNTNVWQISNPDSTIYAFFCTKCGWHCGNVSSDTIKEAREEERKIIEVRERECGEIEVTLKWD